MVALALGALAAAPSFATLPDASCPGPSSSGPSGGGYSAETFMAQHTGRIVAGEMQVQKSIGADWVLHIWNANLTTGPVYPPLGASATIPDSSIPNGVPAPVNGAFSPGVPVTAGATYAISVSRVNGSSFMTLDRNGDPCPGHEFGSNTGMGTWAFALPQFDYLFRTFVEPPNDITVKSQVGRVLTVSVANAGSVSLAGAPVGGKDAAAIAKKGKKRVLIAAAQATAPGPGDVTVPINPTKAGKARFKRKGKLSSPVTVTFTPTGGQAKSVATTVTLKRLKKKKK
jgi:hypothetical protein